MNLAIDWHMVLHYWLQEEMKLVGVAANIKNVLFNSMSQWKTILKIKGVK